MQQTIETPIILYSTHLQSSTHADQSKFDGTLAEGYLIDTELTIFPITLGALWKGEYLILTDIE